MQSVKFSSKQPFSLQGLTYLNQYYSELPGDPLENNEPRQVEKAAHSKIDIVKGTPTKKPTLLSFSGLCAQECLGLGGELLSGGSGQIDEDTLQALSGLKVLDGMQPYAMCYGGHQFGSWAGQLGDGRAIVLGSAQNAKTKQSWELQLKGAGRTPYSRFADGRAVLRSSVREYLCSEAMHGLKIPTTRALSLIMTDEKVIRDMFYDGHPKEEPGAIVCRVARSFIRFGTFELPYSRGDTELLKKLADFTIKHYFADEIATEAKKEDEEEKKQISQYLLFLRIVIRKTAELVAKWQCVGFVHGVMNTDNMSILGLTIDYGPYGFLDRFDPTYTPNTTDLDRKRYVYHKQPQIAMWNLLRLANALFPLINVQKEVIQKEVEKYSKLYVEFYAEEMRKKLGFKTWKEETDFQILGGLLSLMQEDGADFTNTFRNLSKISKSSDEDNFALLKLPESISKERKEEWGSWVQKYQKRAKEEGEFESEEERSTLMNATNPKYILRNYLAQRAIEKAEKGDGGKEINKILMLLRDPFTEHPEFDDYAQDTPKSEYKLGIYLNSCSS